jgi:hypothetical protein
MTSITPQKPATTPIPVQLSETEFTTFIFPHLSMPEGVPKVLICYSYTFWWQAVTGTIMVKAGQLVAH